MKSAGRFKRRPGEVVSIRINPKDCLGILDLMDATKVSVANKSFPQMVSTALAGFIQAARDNQVIPAEPDMFQYGPRMQRYTNRKSSDAGSIASVMNGARFVQPQSEEPEVKFKPTADQRRAVTRMQELEVKKEHAPDTWTHNDELEYKECERVAFG